MAPNLDSGLWLLPSRRRPANLRRFFAALAREGTASGGIVMVKREEFYELASDYDALELPRGWSYVPTDGDSKGDKLRECEAFYRDADWVGLIGDDQEPVTGAWDAKLVASLDGSNLVTCLDDWVVNTPTKFGQSNRMAGVLLFSGALFRAVGYIFPPPLHHVYLDDAWEQLATKVEFWTINREVTILHHHARRDPSRADETDRLAYSGEGSYAQVDFYPWIRWQRDEMPHAAERIAALRGRR